MKRIHTHTHTHAPGIPSNLTTNELQMLEALQQQKRVMEFEDWTKIRQAGGTGAV